MNDVGEEFTDFLKAYGLSDYYKLSSSSVTDAEINVIFARHKANFDAWRKVPFEFRDAYGRIPPYLLEKAKHDPNFTATDAQLAKMDHDKAINPYSPIPSSLADHPIYQDLLAHGIIMTPAHIAAMRLLEDEMRRAGYSNTTAEAVSQNSILRKGLFEERRNLSQNSSLTDYQLAELKRIDTQIDTTRRQDDMRKKEDASINQPERMLMHTLRDLKRREISKNDASALTDLYLKQIVATNRQSLLGAEMGKSLYQKILKAEQRQLLEETLKDNGITFSNKPKENNFHPKDTPKTQVELALLAARKQICTSRD